MTSEELERALLVKALSIVPVEYQLRREATRERTL